MKLTHPIIELATCPPSIFAYLTDYILSLNWADSDYLTKEEAFYNQSFRYEASTDYFNENSYYYSLKPPTKSVGDALIPYTDYLFSELFTDHKLFRCQVVSLDPGQNVYPHIDPRYYHAYGQRIHLPMVVNDKSYHIHFDSNQNYDMIFSKMSTGIITNFDNITPHAAFNYGNTRRIHIICDIVKNSIVQRLNTALNGDPNATNTETVDEYYTHVRAIEARYDCKYQDLKPFYLNKMAEYEQSKL